MSVLAELNLAQGDLRFESRREHEFYRYYEPIRELTENGPPLCDLSDADSISRHRPTSSPDRALTAFCQLGALRLATRRAMLFFFDSKYGYILAEATRTLSLQNDSIHEPDDTLWMGHTIIPRGGSVCEHTVKLPYNEGSNKNQRNSGIVHVVDDLAEDTRFCDRSFVTSGPRARFYAGVPITTPAGINIGAYCVLDDKVRPGGLNDKETQFLVDMGMTVMTHLEMVRAKAELKRSGHMVSSLGTFIGDKSDNGAAGNKSHHQRSITSSDVMKKKHLDVDQLATNVEQVFGQAATLIEKAVDTDGVLFVDASTGHHAGLSETAFASNTDRATDTSASGTDATDEHATDNDDKASNKSANIKPTPRFCKILGSSSRGTTIGAGLKAEIPESFINYILRRHHGGKIWNFNETGFNPSDEDTASDTASDSTTNSRRCTCDFDPVTGRIKHNAECPSPRRRGRLNDSQRIQRLFPGVRSLGIVGVWDHARRRWHSVCIFYAYRPLRVFSELIDATFVSAFCDVMLAKIHRLEAQMSERAKSDFISTISHELRSPLHGILGSVECLQEQSMDSFSSDMVTQIDICGRTLIDIIDHLLDYSKINHLTKGRLNSLPNKKAARASPTLKNSSPGTAIAADVDVPLAQVTEEVIETAVYAYCHSRDPEFMARRKVAVVFQTNIASIAALRFNVAVGAWKRMCINLVSNALKYTSHGHVIIRLDVSQHLNRKRQIVVKFSVTDTGRGMTKEYLENDLFRAFSQENSLIEGAGLGMNLVGKIVKAFNGKIDVQSTENVGTTSTVSIPMHATVLDDASDPKSNMYASPRALAAVSIGVFELEKADQDNRKLILNNARDTLAAIGARVSSVTNVEVRAVDICLCLEEDLQVTQENGQTGYSLEKVPAETPVIIISDNAIVARRLRAANLGRGRKGHIELVAQPAGPERLLKAVRACLDPPSTVATLPTIHSLSTTGSTSVSPLSSPSAEAKAAFLSASDKLPPPPKQEDAHVGEGIERMDFSPAATTLPLRMNEPTIGRDADSRDATSGAINPKPPLPKPKSMKSGKGTPIPLLLVDDNPINLRLLESYAKKNAHPRLTASNGQLAVEAYKAACLPDAIPSSTTSSAPSPPSTPRPRVILMDINMPVLDGFGATRAIRAFERQQELSPPAIIVALTGLGSADAQREAFACGVDLFLTKPVRLAELTRILEGLALKG